MLDKKTWECNLILKVDIKKVFNTLDLRFIFEMLDAFGFNSVFQGCIREILCSNQLSILVNMIIR